MKKRYILKNKKRFITFVAFISVVTFTTLFSVSVYGYKEPTYKEITILQGDTLWDIASRYNTDNDLREYIYKIKKINRLHNSDIYAGSKLMIPVDSVR